MITERVVVAAGVRSPVLGVGPDDAAEAVVFVHGNPGGGAEWTELLQRVGSFARAVAPDMPGYAGADKPRDFDYTVDGYARHLTELLEQLGIRRVHLVLHDFGGPWGLAWAAAHGDQLASITLINIGVLIDYRWHRYARIARTPVLGEIFTYTATRRGFRWLAARDNPGLSREWLDGLYDYSRPSATRRAVLRLYRATPPNVTDPYAKPLRALDPPTLVVWGAADAYLPREQAEHQRQTFPSARIELLEGVGHWSFLEQPERVASLVVPFLTEQLGRAAQRPAPA